MTSRRVLDLDPLYHDAHYNLADALDNAGRREEALPHWRDYLRHDPGSRWGAYARQRVSILERRG
jgi:thioredoxin-like negative regulator of GroEL